MFSPVDTKDPTAVQLEVQAAYLRMFPRGDKFFIPRAFGWAIDYFTGNHHDYQAIDALYHDFEHTLQGALCMVRLLEGRHWARGKPVVSRRMFELGVLAILLHDTGYLKKRDDKVGTGAKYTLTHVTRSAEFAEELLSEKGYGRKDIHAVQHMIRCTGVNMDLRSIPFQTRLETIIGYALGTADLLGQMAAKDYPDKLPILYSEFVEAAEFSEGRMPPGGGFASAEALMRDTPVFWEKYVRVKIERDFCGLYKFLADPYPDGPNDYILRVEANIARVRRKTSHK